MLSKAFFNILLFLTYSLNAFSQKYPEMVNVQGSTFLMGDLREEFVPVDFRTKRLDSGKMLPTRNVRTRYRTDGSLRNFYVHDYSISKQPISVAQYSAYCFSMGFDMPKLPNDIKETDPMINISWEDAESYCRWLSRKTGKKYRLPTEGEWEFASRGAKLNRPKREALNIYLSNYKDMLIDNDAIFNNNGLVWEWTSDVNRQQGDENIKIVKTRQYERVVRKGTTGKKLVKEQPYYRKGLFQDTTAVNVGFRVVENLVELKLYTKKLYLSDISKRKPSQRQ